MSNAMIDHAETMAKLAALRKRQMTKRADLNGLNGALMGGGLGALALGGADYYRNRDPKRALGMGLMGGGLGAAGGFGVGHLAQAGGGNPLAGASTALRQLGQSLTQEGSNAIPIELPGGGQLPMGNLMATPNSVHPPGFFAQWGKHLLGPSAVGLASQRGFGGGFKENPTAPSGLFSGLNNTVQWGNAINNWQAAARDYLGK